MTSEQLIKESFEIAAKHQFPEKHIERENKCFRPLVVLLQNGQQQAGFSESDVNLWSINHEGEKQSSTQPFLSTVDQVSEPARAQSWISRKWVKALTRCIIHSAQTVWEDVTRDQSRESL